MAIPLQETFTVHAPPERVWSFLTDPRRVVQCLPGSELLEERDDGTFAGRIRVQIGPVTATYRGTARFVELDEAMRRAGLVGKGREAGGSGSVKVSMTSDVVALAGGVSEVRVQAEIEMAGTIAQFGRDTIEQAARQLFRQFAGCARTALSRDPEREPVSEALPGGQTPVAVATTPPALGAQAIALPFSTPINVVRLLLQELGGWVRRLLWRG